MKILINKKYMSALLVAAVLMLSGTGIGTADATNLVSNASFETASPSNPNTPDSWFPNSWGTNTPAFAYINGGHTGSRAVQVATSGYLDGDAKWLFNAVPVTAGASYDYSDWYRASAQTNLWARFEMQDGSVQFQWLKAAPAAPVWIQVAAAVTIPANTARASIFHVLNANGQLDIDDVSLTQQASCAVVSQNGLLNGGLEQFCPANPAMPAGWQTQTYGPDPAAYAYTSDAHQGTHAVSMSIHSLNDEAGWATMIQSPASNQRYTFSFWQKGTVYVYAYFTETLSGGATHDVSLMAVPSTLGAWSQFKDSFVTSANVQSLKLTIATAGQGTVTLDDVSLQRPANQAPPTFTNGMVSITFDDGSVSQYNNAVPALDQNGFKATFYVNGDTIGTSGYMSEAQLKTLGSKGNEIASHFYHHSDMVQLDTPTIISELTGNKEDLQEILGTNYPIADFASPYGSFTSGALDTVMQYVSSHRDTDGELNTKANLDPRQIHARLIEPGTTLADVQSWISTAQTQHAWLVLVYHGVTTNPSGDGSGEIDYTITPTAFKSHMTALKASGISVQPVNAALGALLAQK